MNVLCGHKIGEVMFKDSNLVDVLEEPPVDVGCFGYFIDGHQGTDAVAGDAIEAEAFYREICIIDTARTKG